MSAEPPSQPELADEEQLKLLSIFRYVAGGMSAFFACFPLIHLGTGLLMVLGPEKLGSGHSAPPAALTPSSAFLVWMGSFARCDPWSLMGRLKPRRLIFCF